MQRDYRAAQYLAKLLWIGRERPSAFLFDPADNRLIRGTIYSDRNARLLLLGDAGELLNALARPLRNKRGRHMRASVWRAWHRAFDPEAASAVSDILEVLSSDWDDPEGWTRPGADPEAAT